MNWRSRSEPAPISLRLLDFLFRNRNGRGQNVRLPKLVKVRHGHSPMCHRTPRVLFGNALKCIFGGGVCEGVQQSHASVELLLNGRRARNRKRHFSEFLRRAVAMRFLCCQEGKRNNSVSDIRLSSDISCLLKHPALSWHSNAYTYLCHASFRLALRPANQRQAKYSSTIVTAQIR